MLANDRAILRNLLLVLLGSAAATLVIGVSCLGRGPSDLAPASRPGVAAQPPPPPQTPERGSIRSSAGGVTSDPVGSATITSQDLDRGASASGTPSAWPAFRAPPPTPPATLSDTDRDSGPSSSP